MVTVLMGSCSNEAEFDEYLDRIKTFLYSNGVVNIYGPDRGNDFWSEGNIHHLNGYVDHASEYMPRILEIINDEKKLYDFLFNGKTIITIGNDNDENYGAPKDWNYEEEIKKEVW